MAVPGAGVWPKGWGGGKLPIGVALLLSLGCSERPSEPNQAATAGPTVRQPPPTFRHVCRTPRVLERDGATAVITCVAPPVGNDSGRDDARGFEAGGLGAGGVEAGGVDAGRLVECRAAAVVCVAVGADERGAAAGSVGVGAGAVDEAAAAVVLWGVALPEQAETTSDRATRPPPTSRRPQRVTPRACHSGYADRLPGRTGWKGGRERNQLGSEEESRRCVRPTR